MKRATRTIASFRQTVRENDYKKFKGYAAAEMRPAPV